MSRFSAVRLVMGREMAEQLKSRAFQISTVIFLLAVLAGMIIPTFFNDDVEEVAVAVVGEGTTEIMLQMVALGTSDELAVGTPLFSSNVRFVPEAYDSRETAVAAVETGDVELAVIDGNEIVSLSQAGSSSNLLTQVLYSYQVSLRFAEFGVSALQLQSLSDIEPAEFTSLNNDFEESNAILSYISSMILYITILTYGIAVAMSVINEKSSRVVEIVLSAIRPVDLLAGKVLGIGLTGLMQVAAVIAAALITNIFTDTLPLPETGGIVPVLTVALWFLLGYMFYASVYAVIGSSISKVEDLQGVAFPVMIPIIIGFFISFTALEGTETQALKIASFVPFTAPLTMPARMLLGFAPGWQVLVSLVLQVLGVWLVLKFAARAFGGGLLKDRVRLREIFRTS